MTGRRLSARHRPALRVLAAIPLTVALAGCPCKPPQPVPPQNGPVADHIAGPPEVLHDGGPDALTIVILGDGFTADPASMSAYRAAADEFATRLLATAPFSAVAEAFTIIRVDVKSDEAGIEVPDTCGGVPYHVRSPKNPDNFLETSWCAPVAGTNQMSSRFLNSDSPNVALAALTAGVVPDMTVVLVNDWMFGATAWPDDRIVYQSVGKQNLVGDLNPTTGALLQPNIPDAFPNVTVHELGHLWPFLLLDEYGTSSSPPDPAARHVVDASANLTTDPTVRKWIDLVPVGTPVPTDCNVDSFDVGAVPGGYRYSSGVFHSACTCRMNSDFTTPFCLVCRRQILARAAPHLPSMQRGGVSVGGNAWVVLDGLQIKTGPAGYFRVTYWISEGGQTVSGAWPQVGRELLAPGHTAVIGALAAKLPIPSNRGTTGPPGTVLGAIRVQIQRWDQPRASGAGTILADETFPLTATPHGGTAVSMVLANRPAFRLTVGFIVR
jgi:hypothetical protein